MRRRIRVFPKSKSSEKKDNPVSEAVSPRVDTEIPPPPLVPKELATTPVAKKAFELSQQRKAFQLKIAGYTHEEIADELGLQPWNVGALLNGALVEYEVERDKAAKQFLTVAIARYEALHKAWFPKAMGYTESVRQKDGTYLEVHHPPDAEAYRLVLTALRDAAKLFGLNKLRVEHTGANGGAVQVDVDWTHLSDEQLEKLTRGDFGVLRALAAGANPGASAPGDASPESGEERPSSRHH